MKLLAIFSLVLCLHVSAKTYSQNERVSLSLKSASLEQVFKALEKSTNYTFLYRYDYIEDVKKQDVNYSNEMVSVILEKCLKGTGLSYKLLDKTVVIMNANTKTAEQKKKEIVKGKIVDEKGLPLPGVSLVIKGTNVGVSTDVDGNFQIRAEKGDILIASFVGMLTKEVKCIFGQEMKIVLAEDKQELEEVVITGYQKIEKRKLTSSVVTVKGEDVIEPVATSIDQMLQGKIAGVSVLNATSTPGAAPKIRIRGTSSITGNREPVWVVDGVILEDPVPLSTTELNSMDKVNLIGNAISFLNPEDIDRIDVLKDASATAIYGVKAANGVIVITTKKGKKGAPRVSFTSSMSYMQRPNYDDMYRMNSKDRVEVSEEMHRNGLEFSGVTPGTVGYEGALRDLWNKEITYAEFNQQVKQLKENNTDWYDLLFRDAFSHSHNVNISGGGDNTTYYFSAGYSNNKGVSNDVDYTKYNAMLKIDTKLRENLKIGVNLSISSTDNDRPHSSIDLYQYAYQTSRAIPAYNPDGSYAFYTGEASFNPSTFGAAVYPDIEYNILDEMERTGSNTRNQSASATFKLDWELSKNITFNSVLNLTKTNSDSEAWAEDKSFYSQSIKGIPYGVKIDPSLSPEYNAEYNDLPFGGVLSLSTTNSRSYSIRNSVSFNNTIGAHYFETNIGNEVRSTKYDGNSMAHFGYLPDRGKTFATLDIAEYQRFGQVLADNRPSIMDRETNVLSFYGILTYSYDNRYILNFNIRTDGSNKFGEDKSNRFLPVWSVSGRWNMYKESFMKNLEFVDSFSIRTSYGVQGNVSSDQVPNLILEMGGYDSYADFNQSYLYKVPNNKLRWEKTKSYNLGIDFSFLNRRLSGTLELYNKKGEDQIVSKEITTTNGANNVSINDGEVTNKGWEIFLNTNVVDTKDLKWSLSFNTGKNYNEIENAGSTESYTYKDYINGRLVTNGKAINTFYSYKFDKLDENGYPTFKDYNEKDEEGNYLIHSYEEAYNRIFAVSGNRTPDLTGGFSTFFRYKKFSLNAIFAFGIGNMLRLNPLYNDAGQALPLPQQNLSSDFVNRWKKAGDEAHTNIPRLSDEPMNISHSSIKKYMIADNIWEMYNYSDIRLASGDYLKCRNITLNYSFGNDFCKNLKIKGLNMSLTASNVFTLKDSALKGRDPEQLTFGSGTVPPQRSYSFKLTANF